MERSEPTLAPQWLRSGRQVTSFVTASDDHAAPKLANNRSLSMNMTNNELKHSAASHARWSSNSNSSPNLGSYSSFRSHRPRDMDKDINRYRERSDLGNHRSRDLPGSSRKHRWEMFEDGLRHSQPLTPGRSSDKWPRNLSNGGKINLTHNNGKLGAEEGLMLPALGGLRSPCLGTRSQGLATDTSGSKSASALADVPSLTGNSNSGLSSTKQAASSLPSSPISSKLISRGLNMAETVAKGPSCAQTASQLSHANQRREELAVKQSRQLIPLKPLVAKASAPNSFDKTRTKVELPQQTISTSYPGSNSPSSKLLVFKPTREKNGVSSGVNGSLSPNAQSKSPPSLVAVRTSASAQSPANSASSERKPIGTMVEKKLSSQSKSRNDFFNLMRKKSMGSTSAVNGSLEKSGVADVLTASSIPQDRDALLSDESPRFEQSTGILDENACSSDSNDGNNSAVKSFSKSDTILCSEEEEAAFLRSLGWEENADEGGLTEEEISAFHRDVTKYFNSKLSFKIMEGVQSRFLVPLHSGIGDVGGVSS